MNDIFGSDDATELAVDRHSEPLPIASLVGGQVVDPDATLAELDAVSDCGCFPSWPCVNRKDALIFALKAWLDAGGRQPKWRHWPEGTKAYRWRIANPGPR